LQLFIVLDIDCDEIFIELRVKIFHALQLFSIDELLVIELILNHAFPLHLLLELFQLLFSPQDIHTGLLTEPFEHLLTLPVPLV